MDNDQDISQLWLRHIASLKEDFEVSSMEALPSQTWSVEDGEQRPQNPHVGQTWDERMNSVVNALDELTMHVFSSIDGQYPSDFTGSSNRRV